MGYFPFFVNIENAHGLIVGGGVAALKKVQRLLPFGTKLHVVAPDIIDEIKELESMMEDKIYISQKEFSEADLMYTDIENGILSAYVDFVIVASDNRELCNYISGKCKLNRIPVNVVDDIDNCSFIFPSIISKGDLSIAISTGGASPVVAKELKEKIEKVIPEDIEEILVKMKEVRDMMKEKYPDETERAEVFRRIFKI